MISAGVEVLWGYDPDSDRAGEMSMEETVRRIFLAMTRAATNESEG
jgi:hypothetical protein